MIECNVSLYGLTHTLLSLCNIKNPPSAKQKTEVIPWKELSFPRLHYFFKKGNEPKKSALCKAKGGSHTAEGAIIPTAALLFFKKGNEPKKFALCRTEGGSHTVEGAIIPTAALLFLKKGNEPKKSAL